MDSSRQAAAVNGVRTRLLRLLLDRNAGSSLKIALVSLDQIWLNKDRNFVRCAHFVASAAKQACDLVIFPEMTLTGYSLEPDSELESAADSDTVRRFGGLAREAKVEVIFGASLFEAASAPQPRNTLCLARHDGKAEVLYSKIHPFSFAGEDRKFQAGNGLGMTSIGDCLLGCSICYDLRFPELFSVMAPHCNAIVNIANWPARRASHWRSLLVARAIENQLFVFGVNRIGTDGNGFQYEKSSMVVSPDGTVMMPEVSALEMDIYKLDLTETARYRDEFPTVRDKRFALYRELFPDAHVEG